ncbi:hypothetical protein CR205_16125 [Alteribacter lacisalsi]|uniref:Oligogalacturonate lyase domain-containing protein n=1 Tax=Alteribacter lacisalsi TaxID=2045244 RepID=A0A2W0HF17_9BACI|nr:hypothetical protein [Alteribacter lacisalsi]PYZ95905.1 hypothetical protein CR205_16125 [Alteribacter lacisalsi]
MAQYGVKERMAAKRLDAFPRVKKALKLVYQRVQYVRHREKGFTYWSAPDVKVTPAAEEGAGLFAGYFDRSPWNPSMSRMVFHRIIRDQKADIIVTEPGGGLKLIARTEAWNRQQGAMTVWMDDDRLAYVSRSEGRLVTEIADVRTGKKEQCVVPLQAYSRNAVYGINYARVFAETKEYGYEAAAGNRDMDLASDGIWKHPLNSESFELIVSLAQLSVHEPAASMKGAVHHVNHVIPSPKGDRIAFVHRWTGSEGRFSRLYTCRHDGTALKLLFDDRMVSHFTWQDDDSLIVWGRTSKKGDRYYFVYAETGIVQVLGEGILDQYGDGHPSFSPCGRWVITDTYPDKARQQHLLLYDTETHCLVRAGSFFSPPSFTGGARCDLHPRWSPCGTKISIDSAHTGKRESFVVDLAGIL